MGLDGQWPSSWLRAKPMSCPMLFLFSTACPGCRSGGWRTGVMPVTPSASTSGDLGARPAIPSKRNEAPVACPDWAYNNRNQVERLWARLKEWRAIATRYEKTASSFMGVLCLADTLDWLKP